MDKGNKKNIDDNIDWWVSMVWKTKHTKFLVCYGLNEKIRFTSGPDLHCKFFLVCFDNQHWKHRPSQEPRPKSNKNSCQSIFRFFLCWYRNWFVLSLVTATWPIQSRIINDISIKKKNPLLPHGPIIFLADCSLNSPVSFE